MMKRLLFVICLAELLCPACSFLNPDGADDSIDLVEMMQNPLTFSGPEGTMKLEGSFIPSPSDVPGCAGVITHTDGKDVYSFLWLSFYFFDTTSVGSELQLERFHFGAMLSSNSREYTDSFTGKMILKERSTHRVVISMEDVHLRIAHGEYTLNGYLVANNN